MPMANKKLIVSLSILLALVILILASIRIYSRQKPMNYDFRAGLPISDNTLPETEEEIKLIFLGDIMLDRYIRQVMDKKGDDFALASVKDFLAGGDLVIANLEGPITDKPSVSVYSELGERNNYIFTFPESTGGILKKHNIGLVNIGNNHILNFGKSGLDSTKEYLESAGVNYFGDPRDADNRCIIRSEKGIKLGFAGYNQFNNDSSDNIFDCIDKLKRQTNLTIVYTHWGKEYSNEPDKSIQELAHKFIDSGADLVVGTHPHVIQKSEDYKNKKIYYSLGNFVFDQYFNPDATKGLALVVYINPKNYTPRFEEKFVQMKSNGQTVLFEP